MDLAPEPKRRRLRKGTSSCWECKRRKMKCEHFEDGEETSCKSCVKRGSQCVSQELPEEPSPSSSGRYARYTQTSGHNHGISTPVSICSEPARAEPSSFNKARSSQSHTVRSGSLASLNKQEKLSRLLHDSLPRQEQIKTICAAGNHPPVLAHETLTTPYSMLQQRELVTHQILLEIPEPTTHPVLIAKHMLLLASFIQHLHPDSHKEIEGLSESPRAMMERLVDTVTSLVTTNDELLDSIEGLECILIESMYQVNIGNLRRSWISGRRAMSIAQLMGLDRPGHREQYRVLDHRTKHDPQHMWFRILHLDRYLCLTLGISQGCLDRSMASDTVLAKDTPEGRLERLHCVIASRILERNDIHSGSNDFGLTQNLDVELQKAARSLPSKWWLAPDLVVASKDPQTWFWETQRLFAQMLHYNLLNQLHLPYMLSSKSAERKHEYSRITCVNASREMLLRFIAFRNLNRGGSSCRFFDLLALMAAMTLLLAHIDSQRSEPNLLAHQYHSDRAMIEQVQEDMDGVNRLNSDALSAQSADLLRRLLAVESEAMEVHLNQATRINIQQEDDVPALPDQYSDAVASVRIPYFGTIEISRARPSKEAENSSIDHLAGNNSTGRSQSHLCGTVEPNGVPNNMTMTPISSGYAEAPLTISNNFTLPPQNVLSDGLLQQGEYPGLAASNEDWALQGVDLAFFESLMSGVGGVAHDGTDWT